MALVNPVGPLSIGVGQGDGSVQIWTWDLTTAEPIGTAVQVPEYADRTWSVKSASTGGATLKLEGSNTDVTADYAPMHDAAVPANTSWTGVPQCIATVENPRYARPNLTTVGSGATWTVTLCARRANPLRQ